MGWDAEDAEGEFGEALADGRLVFAGDEIVEAKPGPRPATGRPAKDSDWIEAEHFEIPLESTFAGPSPFYNPEENIELQKGVIRHAALEPVDPHDLTKGFQLVADKPEPKLFEKTTAADNYEEIYNRLDRAIILVENENRLRREEGIRELYELRDIIYGGLR